MPTAPKKKTARRKKKTTKRKSSSPPSVRALLLCDAVSVDPNSKKRTLYGLFDKFLPSKFPCRVSFYVLARFVSGRGKYKVSIEIRTPRGKLLQSLSAPEELEFKPDSNTDLMIQYVGVEFQKPGKYRLVVLLDDKKIDELPLTVEKCING